MVNIIALKTATLVLVGARLSGRTTDGLYVLLCRYIRSQATHRYISRSGASYEEPISSYSLERVQNYAMRLIMSAEPRTPSAELRSKLSWMTLQNRRKMQVISKVHRCLQNKAPHYLCSKFETNLNAKYRGTRGSANVQLQRPRTNFYRNSFEFNGAYQWNSLPTYLKSISSYTAFRKALHKHLLQSS